MKILITLLAHLLDALILWIVWPAIAEAFSLEPRPEYYQWFAICVFRTAITPAFYSELGEGICEGLTRYKKRKSPITADGGE